MKFFYCILFSFASLLSYSQVGIGTAAPTADLEVISNTGLASGEFNGIIIPKVSVLPTGGDLPGAPQTGLILYLDSNDAAEGFYYFNGVSYQNVNSTSAFYNLGTTDNASNTTSNITRTGNLSLGSSLNTGKLNIEVTSAASSTNAIGLRINNINSGTGADDTYGIFTENRATATGTKYGIRNDVTSSGNSNRIGIRNEVRNSSVSATNNVIGIDNFVGATNGASVLNYGIRSEIGTASSDTNNFGIYSIARGADSRDNYSGYFRGDKFAIRNEDDSTGYEMPTNNGTNGQVLTTNGAGVASWSGLPANNDNNSNNEGILSVAAGGTNDADIVSTNSANSTNVTIAGGNGINVTETGSTVFVAISARVAMQAEMSANQNLTATNTWEKLNFDTAGINEGGGFNAATDRFETVTDGVYRVTAKFHSSNSYNSSLYVGLAVYVNGSLYAEHSVDHYGNGQIERNISTLVELSGSDYIEIYARTADTALIFDSFKGKTFFEVELIR